jgi:hypothetical protein
MPIYAYIYMYVYIYIYIYVNKYKYIYIYICIYIYEYIYTYIYSNSGCFILITADLRAWYYNNSDTLRGTDHIMYSIEHSSTFQRYVYLCIHIYVYVNLSHINSRNICIYVYNTCYKTYS